MLAFEAFVNVSVVVVLQPFSKIIDSDFVKLSASSESTGSFSGPGGGVGRSGVG